jgi:hypothetical protein
MRKASTLFFLILTFILGVNTLSIAQEKEGWSNELITFPDGETEEYYVYYDAFQEWLYFENRKGEVRYFIADDVVSFTYRGNRYYSLPFQNGSLSFFKVEYEGENTALLSKPNSINLMHYLAKRYNKLYTLCDGFNGKNGVRLCRIDYSIGGVVPASIAYSITPVPRPLLEKTLEPVYIKKCLFVAGEKGMEIIQVNVDQEFLGLFTKDEIHGFESLEAFFGRETYRKLHTYAKENKLKEHRLEDLKILFRYYESI